MEKFADWLIRNPVAVPLFVAAVGAWGYVNVYRIGMAHARLMSAAEFAASEALGG